MLLNTTWLRLAAAGFLFILSANAAELTLAREGKALVTIVRPIQPSPAETTAVAELADYLGKITGATFAVIDETALPAATGAIYLGPTAFSANQGIDMEKLGKEEAVIRTVNGSLIITGGRPRGTLYGVYRFLEDQLGVRWYNQWCEKVPSLPECTIGELDLRRKPYLEAAP